jgi:hypothetical protein
MTISYLSSVVVLSIFARDKIKNRIKIEFLKKWLRLFWFPVYPGIAIIIASMDVTIFLLITGSVEGLAFWSAAMAISLLITNSRAISMAVYPKLLGEEKSEYLQENITQLFYFAIPITALTISFAKPALFALNPMYETAFPVVIFTSIYMFFHILNNVFQSILTGSEKVDLNHASIKDYYKSKLFSIPTISLFQSILYIGLIAVGLLVFESTTHSQLSLVVYWSVIAFVTSFPFTIYLYILIKKNFNVSIDVNSVSKYLITSVGVFGITYVLTEYFLVYEIEAFRFIPNLLLFVGLGIGGYISITYLIDWKTRNLFKAIVGELKKS